MATAPQPLHRINRFDWNEIEWRAVNSVGWFVAVTLFLLNEIINLSVASTFHLPKSKQMVNNFSHISISIPFAYGSFFMRCFKPRHIQQFGALVKPTSNHEKNDEQFWSGNIILNPFFFFIFAPRHFPSTHSFSLSLFPGVAEEMRPNIIETKHCISTQKYDGYSQKPKW